MMKNLLNVFGALLLVLGFLAIGGSANDCDGKCMEYANDIPTMLLVVGGGLLSCLLGGWMIFLANERG